MPPMTTIDSTYSRPWFVASTSDSLDIGSWTLRIICQRVMPLDRAASTVVGATPRMPSATSLVAIGNEYATAAMIAVNRPGRNRASAGTRYTNGGITWKASRNGRMITSALRLRPMATPRTIAMIITISVATSVIDNVIMVSFQRPVAKMTASQTSVTTVGRQPPSTYDTASNTAAVSHQGDSASRSCSGLISQLVTSSLNSSV